MQDDRPLRVRTLTGPGIPLPFGARSVGHYRIRSGKGGRREGRTMLQLFWGIKGKGCFRLRDKTFRLCAGDVFYYLPGDPHDITPDASEWEYRWLTMDGPLAAPVVQSFGLVQTLVPSGGVSGRTL